MFGSPNKSTIFGTQNSTSGGLFGSSVGATTSSAFGATPSLFGQPAQPAAQTSSLFGQTTTPSSSLFGSNVGTASKGFGATVTGGGGLFGSTTSGFGGFGGTSTNQAGTGLFGQPAQAQTTSLFNQPAAGTGTGLFGSSSGGFGGGAVGATGTIVKFQPVTGTDSMIRNGVTQTINTKHHCITCMKEYESKSLEELRFEDYVANRKGPAQGTQPSGGLFGAGGQTMFGSNAASMNTAGGGSLFGSTTSGFGQTNVFGQQNSGTGGGLFGKSTSTTPFGGGTTTTTPSTGFAFGQSSSLFGANTNQPKPAFGTGGLFGSTTTGTTSSAFGTQPTSFGFGSQTQAQGTGLFGGATTTSKFGGGFGGGTAQTTSAFPFGSNTTPSLGGSLFGAKAPTPGFGLNPPVGTVGTTPFGSTGFGVASNTAAGSGGLFGAGSTGTAFSKPATTGFSFGQTATQPTLGGGMAAGGSLFGNVAAKPGGSLFGGMAGAGTTGSGGLFGGGSTAGAFGATNTFANSTLNSTGGAFGSLNFGNTGSTLGLGNVQQPPLAAAGQMCEQLQILSVMPYGDSALYKNVSLPTGKTNELLKPTYTVLPKKSLDQNYKVSTRTNNALGGRVHSVLERSRRSLFGSDGSDREECDKTQNRQQASPRFLKLKPRPPPPATEKEADGDKENISLVQQKTPLFAFRVADEKTNINDDKSGKNNSSPSSPKSEKPLENTMLELNAANMNNNKKNDIFQTTKDSASDSFHVISSSDDDSNGLADGEDEEQEDNNNKKVHRCGVKLRRSGYFTVPSLDQLDEMTDSEGHCVVKNFTVGRHRYGNVTFYDSFDVAGINLDEIVMFRHKEVEIYPDERVKPPIGQGLNRRAQVTLDRVWPVDKTTRQPINDAQRLKQMNFVAKLKRSAGKMNTHFIEYRPLTGSWVFEVEHFSKYGLDDSDDEDVVPGQQVKPKNMSVPAKQPPKDGQLRKMFAQKKVNEKKKVNETENDNSKKGLDGRSLEQSDSSVDMALFDENDEAMAMYDDVDYTTSSHNKFNNLESSMISGSGDNEIRSPVEKLVRNLNSSSLHKVQLMKASFFVDERMDLDQENVSPNKDISNARSFSVTHVGEKSSSRATNRQVFPSLFKSHCSSSAEVSAVDSRMGRGMPLSPASVAGAWAKAEDEDLRSIAGRDKRLDIMGGNAVTGGWSRAEGRQRAVVRYGEGVVPRAKSVAHAAPRSLFTAPRGFRIRWAPGLTFGTLLSKRQPVPLQPRSTDDFTCDRFALLALHTHDSHPSNDRLEKHLEISLAESCIYFEEGCPVFEPKFNSVDELHAHLSHEQKVSQLDEDYNRQIWELMVALWGGCDGKLDTEDDLKSHDRKMLRKNNVSNWLKSVVSNTALNEANNSLSSVDTVLSYLSAGEVLKASEAAIANGDYNLSLLLSQAGGSEITRSLMEQQLQQWRDSEADRYFQPERLKLMTLVAGRPVYYLSSHETLAVCQRLDWKRAFAVHLWYITRTSDSLTVALAQYEDAFSAEEELASPPYPSYTNQSNFVYETFSGSKPRDLCFHLLKLYSKNSYSLEMLLNPVTHTTNILDYRLSWFVMCTLRSLGYRHLSEEAEYIIHTSFASQLEIYGLWHWSIYVLLHISDLNCRLQRVLEMLERNAGLLEGGVIGFTNEERFISEKLQVPATWIFNAKAILANSRNRYKEAAWYYVKAERWNEAHELIISHLVPTAIMNGKYELIEELLGEMVASERVISGWNHKGSIIWQFLTINNEVNSLIENQSTDMAYVLEALHPVLSEVCTKIKFYPTSTAKDSLCQAEISKRMIDLIRMVQNLEYGTATMSIRYISALIDQLPLPDDYKRQELDQVVAEWS